MSFSRRSFLCRAGFSAAGLSVFPSGVTRSLAEAVSVFPRSTPGAEGVDPAGIGAFLDAAAAQGIELHSVMIARHGRVVAEGWWAPYAAERKHGLYSLSKSFTSTAVGLLVGDGKLRGEDRVTSFFPDNLPESVSAHLAAMRVQDLLTMSTGHAKDPTHEMAASENWARFFLAWPVEHAPGTHFVYNSGATYLLSAIVQKLTGRTVLEVLRERIFAPLGVTESAWELSPQGICTGGWGLSVPTEAIARFLRLYQQEGQWNGKQLVPAAWIREATTKHIQQPLPEKPGRPNAENDWVQGYGYQFWRCTHNAWRGDGAFGQFAISLPEQDALVVITAETGDMQRELDLVWTHLLPAMKPDALPADPAAESALRKRLAGLTLALPAGIAPPETRLGDGEWTLEKHPTGLTRMACTFTREGGAEITFHDASGAQVLTCEPGRWHIGETAWPGEPPGLVIRRDAPGTRFPVATAGAWKDADTFVLLMRFVELPHHDQFTFRFRGDGVEVSFRNSLAALAGKDADSRPVLRGKRSPQ